MKICPLKVSDRLWRYFWLREVAYHSAWCRGSLKPVSTDHGSWKMEELTQPRAGAHFALKHFSSNTHCWEFYVSLKGVPKHLGGMRALREDLTSESVTVASQSSVCQGETPGWEGWGNRIRMQFAVTRNLHTVLICLNAECSLALSLYKHGFLRAAPFLRSSSVAQSTQMVRLGYWVAKKEGFVLFLSHL